jgi:dihydrofolate reductase
MWRGGLDSTAVVAPSFMTSVMPRPDRGDDAVRKVVVSEYLSLDGVAEQPDEFVFVTDFDESMEEDFARGISSQDTVLLGRRTYDDWAAFWPSSDIEPFASFINPVVKFVITSTPLELT